MKPGMVHLVGAGPGDPGLLTLAARRCLESAGAVVYDRLLSPRVLNFAPAAAEFHYVGKGAGEHTVPQEDISRLLVSLARRGLTVVRLKGGDPFVFGRGGEEAEALAEAGVAFAVVPGISSAVAVPAYAGIPVTHRSVAHSFTVAAGQCSAGEKCRAGSGPIPGDGTQIILMGVSRLPEIAARLQAAGRSPDTPAALIRFGTTAAQETLCGVLADIAERAEAASFQAPVVLVVGEAVRMRGRLAWREGSPLFGRRVAVAAEMAADALAAASRWEARGAEVFDFALERYAALRPEALEWAAELRPGDAVRVASKLGAHLFVSALRAARRDWRTLAGVRVEAAGKRARAALREFGVEADGVRAQRTPAHPDGRVWRERSGPAGGAWVAAGRTAPLFDLRLDLALPLRAWLDNWHDAPARAVWTDGSLAFRALAAAAPDFAASAVWLRSEPEPAADGAGSGANGGCGGAPAADGRAVCVTG